jgi:hypothetical protein
MPLKSLTTEVQFKLSWWVKVHWLRRSINWDVIQGMNSPTGDLAHPSLFL